MRRDSLAGVGRRHRAAAVSAIASLGMAISIVGVPFSFAAEAGPGKFADGWRKTVELTDPDVDGRVSKCIAWVNEGWLIVERRDVSGDMEWQIVLAKTSNGDEPPTIEPNPKIPGGLRLDFRKGRFFIRDDFGNLRCRRQIKTADADWPALTIPVNEPQPGGSLGGRPDRMNYFRVNHGWQFIAHGMKDERAELVLRMCRFDPEESGGIGSSSNRSDVVHTRVSGPPKSADRFPQPATILDDRELLIVQRDREVDAQRRRATREQLEADRKKLVGAAAPEISAGKWLNSPQPLSLKELKGKVVLVYFAGDYNKRVADDLTHIQALHEKFREQGFEAVGVVSADDAGYYSVFLFESGVKVPLALDDGQTAERFLMTSGPCCFLIGRDGAITAGHYYQVRVARGPTPLPDSAEIEKLLQAGGQ